MSGEQLHYKQEARRERKPPPRLVWEAWKNITGVKQTEVIKVMGIYTN